MNMPMDLATHIKEIPTTATGDITDHTKKVTTVNPTVEATTVEEIVTAMQVDKVQADKGILA